MEGKWTCAACGVLLGVEVRDRMSLRHKKAQYVVEGNDYNVIAVCRKCSTINERSRSKKS